MEIHSQQIIFTKYPVYINKFICKYALNDLYYVYQIHMKILNIFTYQIQRLNKKYLERA